MTTFTEYDAAQFLDSDESISEYLTACAATGHTDVLIDAIADVARARGMSQIARDAGIGRESLYKSLAKGAKPRYETIAKVLESMGMRLAVVPAH